MAFPINPDPGDTYTDEYGTVWVYAGPINGWYRQTVIPVNDTTYIGSDGAPGGIGNNTEVVFNDNGSLASDSGLTYNKTTDALSGGAFIPTGSTVPSNGVYRPSANNVAISTNGTGRLFIDASGRIGIGTATANSVLHIASSDDPAITIADTSVADTHEQTVLMNNGGNFNIRTHANDGTFKSIDYIINRGASGATSHVWRIENSEQMRLDSSGRLGLGTSAPLRSLHIAGVGDTGLMLQTTNAVDDKEIWEIQVAGDASNHANLIFRSRTNAGTGGAEALRITNDGKVGIGSTTVEAKCHIQDTSNTTVRIKNASTSSGSTARLDFATTTGSGTSARIEAVRSADQSVPLIFYSAPSNAVISGEGFRLDGDGRLLVGTSSARTIRQYEPNLQVVSDSASGSTIAAYRYHTSTVNANGPRLLLARSGANTLDNTIVADGNALGEIAFCGADGVDLDTPAASIKAEVDGTPGANDMPGRLVLSTTSDGASSPTERLRIDSQGRVGIGTASPSTPLEVESSEDILIRAESTDRFAHIDLVDNAATTRFTTDGATGTLRLRADIGDAATGSTIQFEIDGSEHARIDSSGRLLVGTSSSSGQGSTLQVIGDQPIQIHRGVDGTNACILNISKSRNTTYGSYTIVQNDDDIGAISFRADDGTNYATTAAQIVAAVDGTPGANDMPGRLVFSTTSDSASSPTERLRITSDAYVRLASGTGGIQFNGDTAAANALDDYEEGTFTPVIEGTTSAGTGTYTFAWGYYTKVGNVVNYYVNMYWTAHTGTGNMIITGLPYVAPNLSNRNYAASVIANNISTSSSTAMVKAYIKPNEDKITMLEEPIGGGIANLGIDSAGSLFMSGSYLAA
ncbi:hypothetical protein SYPG_00041 [Synechococcus phage S-CBP3]|uniref:Uncharacterized protein n=2 Tax=Synechococcus phage S-CBP3 TaxID=756276 RepID=I3ULX6_9CAUD|nr:tail fiber protein [Synechococcus phage S-CBP3]YP_009822272.1 tail fiber protein [Synechococcus phage S-CBP3]AFK66491.1 hypothetical protein SYPG_00041 [Synechococcus phage S-CBP3]AGK86557.1 hypothetical protein S-CBP3_0055 [Synechococcus phage S-CBP3]